MSSDIDARPGSLLINSKELATMLHVSERTLWRHVSAGLLPAPIRFGGNTRWKMEEVRAWIDGGCQPVPDTSQAS